MNNFIAQAILLGLGLIFGLIGYFFKKRVAKFKKFGVKTISTVVDYETEVNTEINDGVSQKSTTFYPIVEFANLKNEIIKETLTVGSTRKGEIGKKIDIYYLEKEGRYSILVDSKFLTLILPIIFYIIGAILIFFGFLFF